MSIRNRLSISLLSILAALVVWSCAPGFGAQKDAAAPNPKPVKGGGPSAIGHDLTLGGVKPAKDDTLMLHYADDPDTVNPITASDTASEAFQREVYEGMADQDYHDPDKFVPALAESWDFDKDKLEFTIHLRKGVKWQSVQLPNGELLPAREMTSRDVKFTFDCVLNKHIEAAHIRSYYEDPDDPTGYKIQVSVVDDYTVKVRWTKPYFLAKEFTLGGFAIIPQHVFSVDENGEPISADFSSKEFADGFNKHWGNKVMCGTGPMKFGQWRRNERLELERNVDYWGHPYYFSRIVFLNISNPNTVTQQVLQKQLDFAGISQKDQFLQIQDKPTVKSGEVKLVKYDYPGYRYIGYNENRELFKDKRVRWALSHAVPVQRIVDYVFVHLAQPISGPFMPGSSACDPAIKPVSYDLDASRKLLDEAGWREGPDGVREKKIDGVTHRATFELMIYSSAPQYKTVAEIIKENFRKIGVDVRVAPVDWALMLPKLNKKDFDAAMLGWALSWHSDPYQLFHGSQADTPDSSNFIGYRNPELDRLIEQLRITMDEAKQIEIYHKIHRIIYDDQPYTFLFADEATAGYDARLENVKFFKIRPCVDSREWYSNRPRILGQ